MAQKNPRSGYTFRKYSNRPSTLYNQRAGASYGFGLLFIIIANLFKYPFLNLHRDTQTPLKLALLMDIKN